MVREYRNSLCVLLDQMVHVQDLSCNLQSGRTAGGNSQRLSTSTTHGPTCIAAGKMLQFGGRSRWGGQELDPRSCSVHWNAIPMFRAHHTHTASSWTHASKIDGVVLERLIGVAYWGVKFFYLSLPCQTLPCQLSLAENMIQITL